AGLRAQRQQPLDLHPHAGADQAVLGEDRAQGVDLAGIAAVERGQGEQGGIRHGRRLAWGTEPHSLSRAGGTCRAGWGWGGTGPSKGLVAPASDGAAAARGYGAPRGSASCSNARPQHVRVLLAPYPRATASSRASRRWLRSCFPLPLGRDGWFHAIGARAVERPRPWTRARA